MVRKRQRENLKRELAHPWRQCLLIGNALLAFLVSVLFIDTLIHGAILYAEKVLNADLPSWLEPTLLYILVFIIGITAFLCALKHIAELVHILFKREK